MAQVDYRASKACGKCGDVLLSVVGESGSATLECLTCKAKQPCMKPSRYANEDPGNEFFEGKAAKVVANPVSSTIVQNSPISDPLGMALNALRSLPMPKDIKQFKKINKIVALIEELQNEQY